MRKIADLRQEHSLVREKSWIRPREIKEGLKTEFIGQEIHHFAKVTSTNDVAKELARKGAKEGTVVISETQTLGRGRLGRRWTSPQGGIWFSIVLRPRVKPKEASKLTFVTVVAVAQAIREMFKLDAEIKWPNDVLIGGKKVCGILTETRTKGDVVDFVVVGIGINANVSLNSFPEDFRNSVTSLVKEKMQEIEREEFLRVLLEEMERYYTILVRKDFDLILDEWRKLASFLGQYVEITSFDQKIRGQAVDVDSDGSLIVKLTDGSIKKVMTGDVIAEK
jgi:BirA family biotin operon repressor/biotin-[acetyl-CoA-carboxylase] ligase